MSIGGCSSVDWSSRPPESRISARSDGAEANIGKAQTWTDPEKQTVASRWLEIP